MSWILALIIVAGADHSVNYNRVAGFVNYHECFTASYKIKRILIPLLPSNTKIYTACEPNNNPLEEE